MSRVALLANGGWGVKLMLLRVFVRSVVGIREHSVTNLSPAETNRAIAIGLCHPRDEGDALNDLRRRLRLT
jgi:hypothetical protein